VRHRRGGGPGVGCRPYPSKGQASRECAAPWTRGWTRHDDRDRHRPGGLAALTAFSSTAVAKGGPALLEQPSKIVINATTNSSAFGTTVITNNSGVALSQGSYTLSGEVGGGIVTP